MPIDDETATAALLTLQASIIALVEDAHPRLVEAFSPELEETLRRFAEVRRLGLDLAAFAEAAAVLLRRSTLM